MFACHHNLSLNVRLGFKCAASFSVNRSNSGSDVLLLSSGYLFYNLDCLASVKNRCCRHKQLNNSRSISPSCFLSLQQFSLSQSQSFSLSLFLQIPFFFFFIFLSLSLSSRLILPKSSCLVCVFVLSTFLSLLIFRLILLWNYFVSLSVFFFTLATLPCILPAF